MLPDLDVHAGRHAPVRAVGGGHDEPLAYNLGRQHKLTQSSQLLPRVTFSYSFTVQDQALAKSLIFEIVWLIG